MGTLTLTGLIPLINASLDTVAREQVGLISAVSRDASLERAAIGQIIASPTVGAMAAEDLNVGAYAADFPSRTINYVNVEITREKSVPFGVTGNQNQQMNNAGITRTITQDSITQAFRTLTNSIEADLASLHIYASRATGTATGTPFSTAGDLSDFANANEILDENGAPQLMDRHMVLGSRSMSRLRGKQNTLFQVNTSGTDDLLRRGIMGEVEGFNIHQSKAIQKLVTTGTSNSAGTTDATGYAIGSTVITLASAGTGTLITGDIITFAGDANEYVLASGDTDTSNGGTITLAAPGLQKAIPASATTITLIAATTRNMFMHKSAIQLVTRMPAMPDGGDAAIDILPYTDPVSGITYEFAVYAQKRQLRYEVNLAWGYKVIKPEFLGLLIGA